MPQHFENVSSSFIWRHLPLQPLLLQPLVLASVSCVINPFVIHTQIASKVAHPESHAKCVRMCRWLCIYFIIPDWIAKSLGNSILCSKKGCRSRSQPSSRMAAVAHRLAVCPIWQNDNKRVLRMPNFLLPCSAHLAPHINYIGDDGIFRPVCQIRQTISKWLFQVLRARGRPSLSVRD